MSVYEDMPEGIVESTRESRVNKSVTSLQGQVNRLDKLFTELETRLSDVRRSVPQESVKGETLAEVASPLVGRIADCTDAVRRLGDRAETLLQELET